MKKIAFITGITGQDGAYLAQFLLNKNYIVHGLKRRTSMFNTQRIDNLFDDKNFHLHFGDMSDGTNLIRLISEIKPDEIYNLAAMSHVHVSFELPEYVGEIDGLGTLKILEAIRILGLEKKTKIYQASTSELYGKVQEIPQNEDTPFYPRSPYGVAKLYAFWITKNYREAYKLFACNGILFNHESPLRGETFVTRKITRAVARISLGLQDNFSLGNLNAKRDWGHAKDYVEMMWMILQHNKAEDWVIATGKTHTVRQFVELSFKHLGINIEFKGEGINEKGIVKNCLNPEFQLEVGKEVLHVNPNYFRPTEVDLLVGDASKAKNILGWIPKISLDQLVSEMVDSDLLLMKKNKILSDSGFDSPNDFE